MDNTYDFVAWAEDRAALRQFRKDQLNERLSEAETVSRLKGDAAKINVACDQIDQMTAKLANTAQS